MERLTRKELARTAARRWKETYFSESARMWISQTAHNTYERLQQLPVPIDPDTVDRITGQPYWTVLWCDQCDTPQEEVVRFGKKDCFNAYICWMCLDQALCLKA